MKQNVHKIDFLVEQLNMFNNVANSLRFAFNMKNGVDII